MTVKRVALITGGAQNIGAAIARRLGADGCTVAVNYLTSVAPANSLVDELTAQGVDATAIAGDVGDPEKAQKIFAAIVEKYGGVDILVNNAGKDMGGAIAISDTDEALYDALFAINTKGSFNMMREAARHMRDGGRIINISTSLIGLALPGRCGAQARG